MTRHWLAAIAYGMAASLLIILAAALLLASLLRFTSFSESGNSFLPVVISLIALFTGGAIAGSKLKQRGLLAGGLTGLFFSLFSLSFQYLGLNHSPGVMPLIFLMANIAAAALGGVAGVNLFSGKHRY
jgi:putative membrane protein, TIGR04086 family/integral membrane protein, TIGR04097 family